jgi:hypothetical protein
LVLQAGGYGLLVLHILYFHKQLCDLLRLKTNMSSGPSYPGLIFTGKRGIQYVLEEGNRALESTLC